MNRVSALLASITLALSLAACSSTPAPVVDTQAPTVASVTPTVTASTVTLALSVSDNTGPDHLEYRLDGGEPVRVDLSGDGPVYSFDLPGLAAGTHTLIITVYDAAGNAAEPQTVTFTVGDTTAPTGVALSASATSVTQVGSVVLSATASDNVGVSKIEFYEGSTKLGTDSTPADGFTQPVTFTLTSNGSHSYTAKAYDAAGNVATSSAVTVTVNIPTPVLPDTTAPTVSATSTVTQTASAMTATAQIVATDDRGVTTLRYHVDAGSDTDKTVSGAGPFSISLGSLSVGPHTLTVTALDAAGNASTARTLNFTIADVTVPTVSATLTQVKGSYHVTASVTASDDIAVTSQSYAIDGGAAVAFTGSSVDLGVLSAGDHSVVFTASDAAGNKGSATALITVAVPDAPPAPTLTVTPENPAGGDTVTLTATGDDTTVSVKFYVNGTLLGEDATPGNGFTWTTTVPTDQSSVTFSAVACNAAGVCTAIDGAGTAPVTIRDTTSPTVTATLQQAKGSYDVTATVTAGDNIGVTGRSYVLDGGAATPFSGGSIDLGALSIGSHTLDVTVTDAAGNTASTTTTLTVVDVTKPTVDFTLAQGAGTYTVTATVTASDNVAVTAEHYSIDGGSDVDFTGNSANLGDLSIGEHTVVVTVMDAAGNQSSATHTITVADVTKPTVSVDSVTRGNVNGSGYDYTAAVSASDNVGVTGLSYVLDSGAATSFTGSTINLSALSLGNHTLTVTAVDAAGNSASSAASTFTVTDVTAPSAPGVSTVTSALGGQTITLTATGVSDNVAVTRVDFYSNGTLIGSDSDPAGGFTLSTVVPNVSGPVTYTAVAIDAANNSSATGAGATVSVTADTTAPTVTGPTYNQKGNGQTTITATLNDNVGVALVELKYNLKNSGTPTTKDVTAFYNATTKTFSYSASDLANTAGTISLVVSDGAGNKTTTLIH